MNILHDWQREDCFITIENNKRCSSFSFYHFLSFSIVKWSYTISPQQNKTMQFAALSLTDAALDLSCIRRSCWKQKYTTKHKKISVITNVHWCTNYALKKNVDKTYSIIQNFICLFVFYFYFGFMRTIFYFKLTEIFDYYSKWLVK